MRAFYTFLLQTLNFRRNPIVHAQISAIMECMSYYSREITPQLQAALERGKSVLLLGARQTGKTTLLNQFSADLSLNFIQPETRLQFEMSLGLLRQRVEGLAQIAKKTPLVVLDEIQRVPQLMDAAQDLIDRKLAQFIFTGSSARKLKHPHINLLPGRVVNLHLYPLSLGEIPTSFRKLEGLLLYGSLPGIISDASQEAKETDLKSYVEMYLEEEIRAESLVRQIASFARFLELAASESGNIVNFTKLSQEIGVAHTTIANYYQILEDCLVAERIEPLIKTANARRKLTKTCKYLIFDLGVRRLAAREGIHPSRETYGKLFEQFVGLEILRNIRNKNVRDQLYFWRDANGPEVDWVIMRDQKYIPIEVKWTEMPGEKDCRHLEVFCEEYNAEEAYIVCRTPYRLKLNSHVIALPWQELSSV